MSGEQLRDTLFVVSHTLDPRQFGPSIPVHITPFMEGRGRPSSGPMDGNRRRSLYCEVRRNFLSPMMLAFDTPIPFSCVGRRSNSNVPAQALILMNDPLVILQAERWADALLQEARTDADRIGLVYLNGMARQPSSDEVTMAGEFLTQQRAEYASAGWDSSKIERQAWSDLCHVVLNLKEFLFVR